MDAPNHLDPVTPPASWPTPPPLPTHQPNKLFFGRFGLRAGWGIAIFVVVFIILTVIAGLFATAATGHLHEIIKAQAYGKAHPELPKPKLHVDFVPIFVIVNDGLTFLGLLGLCWFFSKGERRPLSTFGIGKNRLVDILPGAFWGLATMSLLIFVLHAGHLLVFDGQNIHGPAIVLYGLKWLLAFLLVGFSEEYTFRGYLQFAILRGFWGRAEKISPSNPRAAAFIFATFITSLIFALAHTGNGGETFFGLVQVFLAGVVFAYALWRTGSLWWGIGFHMTWDWAQSFLFGVADSGNVSIGRLFITHPQGKPILSGGPTGPEGSIFATIALLLTILIIHLTTRPGPQPAVEQQPAAHELPSISPYAA